MFGDWNSLWSFMIIQRNEPEMSYFISSFANLDNELIKSQKLVRNPGTDSALIAHL